MPSSLAIPLLQQCAQRGLRALLPTAFTDSGLVVTLKAQLDVLCVGCSPWVEPFPCVLLCGQGLCRRRAG